MFNRLLRFAARAMLSGIFLRSGYRMLQDASPQVNRAQEALPMLPNLELGARATAGVMVGGGLGLAMGIAPRLSAAALAATLFPATYIGHPFWREEDPQARNQQLTQFLKNLGLFGGLVYVALDTSESHRR